MCLFLLNHLVYYVIMASWLHIIAYYFGLLLMKET